MSAGHMESLEALKLLARKGALDAFRKGSKPITLKRTTTKPKGTKP